VTRLPATVDDLRGLRAARWIRESTAGQADHFGPDAQREQQREAIARYGLTDTGIEWQVAHSGRTVGTTDQFAQMLDLAGRQYDVLVVGYVSRFARNLRTAVNARHDLHAAGAVLLFADERVLSADEDAWETWAREAVEAEAYSRRLGKRIREGYAAKFRRHADPGGRIPLGFRRAGSARTLEVDPETIGRVIALFDRYATGTVSIERVAVEAGMVTASVNDLLKNPVYNGWAGRKGERVAAAWRAAPPVDDLTWERVQSLLDRRFRGGGPRPAGRVDLIAGLLRCECGASVVSNGVSRGRRARVHLGSCDRWGSQRTYTAETWERPIIAQVRGIRDGPATVAAIVAALRETEHPPAPIDDGRIERERRSLALAMAAGRIGETEFLAGIAALRERTPAPSQAPIDAARVTELLGDVARTWDRKMTDRERADLVAAIYDRITVRGPTFVGVRLTPWAYAHGLALALPERVRIELAGEEGISPARSIRVPIEGAAEWRAAARIRAVG
jgi:DNA invertase Pin-like site-specific DNA recombinase